MVDSFFQMNKTLKLNSENWEMKKKSLVGSTQGLKQRFLKAKFEKEKLLGSHF